MHTCVATDMVVTAGQEHWESKVIVNVHMLVACCMSKPPRRPEVSPPAHAVEPKVQTLHTAQEQ